MPSLVRLRTSRVGHKKARLDGLDIDFTKERQPVDSIIYGRNGCGKSSTLQLLFAMLLPYRRDFLGKSGDGDRNFDLYFYPREVSFIVTEWEFLDSLNALPGMDKGRRRVFGRCMQKTKPEAGTRAAEYDEYFFSFWTTPGLTTNELPLTDNVINGSASYVKSTKEFHSWFREFTKDRYDLEPYINPDRSKWMSHLSDCGIDLDLIRLMMKLNHGEGVTSEFFSQFKTEESVVRFITEMLSDEDSSEKLRKMVEGHMESLRVEPFVRRRKDLLDTLTNAVTELAPHAKNLVAADKLVRDKEINLTLVTGRVGKTRASLAERAETLAQEIEVVKKDEQKAHKELKRLQAESRWLQEKEAELSVTEAKKVLTNAEAEEESSKRDVHVAKAILAQKNIDSEKNREVGTQKEIAARIKELKLDDLNKLANDCGANFKECLDEAIKTASSGIKKADDTLTVSKKKRSGISNFYNETTLSLGGLQSDLKSLTETEERREKSLEALVEANAIETVEDSTCDALAIKQEGLSGLSVRDAKSGVNWTPIPI